MRSRHGSVLRLFHFERILLLLPLDPSLNGRPRQPALVERIREELETISRIYEMKI